MILCITPNAAVDRTLTVPGFSGGGVFRPVSAIAAAGGKGINVVRAVHNLGGVATCCGFIAGFSGQFIADQVQHDGYPARWTHLEAGESRTCIILVDPDKGMTSVINERGMEVSAADWSRLRDDVFAAADGGSARAIVSIAGSLPPGSSPDIFASLLRDLVAAGCEVWADTSGAALAAAVNVRGVHLKINHEEANELDSRADVDADEHFTIRAPRDAAFVGAGMSAHTRGMVIITMGALGAVFVDENSAWHALPPTIKAKNAVGSGDSFLAGVLLARERDDSPPELLRDGAAAGAANALSGGGGCFDKPTFDDIRAQTVVERV